MALRTGIVLALRALGLGDLLTGVPALRALREAFPRALLVLACPEPLHQLVHTWGLADETLDVRPLEQLPRSAGGADLAVNLHGRGPESTSTLLATEPRRLIAFAHPSLPATARSPEWRADEHEVDRWCRLLSEEGIPADPGSRNYWAFIGEYSDRMPEETKDYVLKIFAAAVIGESPRLFGFDMDNPLAPYLEVETE